MRLEALILALLPFTLASTCSQLRSCTMCDSAVSSDGEQSCGWCVHTQGCVPLGGLECAFGVKITSKDDCPRDILKGNDYNETFAKTIMLAVSGAAYSSNPQPCLTKVVHGAQLRRQITVRCDSVKDDLCSGFTAVSHFHKAIIVGFRGSAGSMQIFLEGIETIFNNKVKVIGGGMVSKYFYDAFESVWKGGMVNDFAQLTKEYPDYELWITGHSLGGSMAAIASNVIVGSKIFPGERIKVITFGEPRTGDHNFAAAHDSMVPYTYRITHSHDMVPHVPTRDFRGFHHHRYEIWYSNKMTDGTTYNICLTPDDESCSDSNTFDMSIDDHLHYFNMDVSALGERGCA